MNEIEKENNELKNKIKKILEENEQNIKNNENIKNDYEDSSHFTEENQNKKGKNGRNFFFIGVLSLTIIILVFFKFKNNKPQKTQVVVIDNTTLSEKNVFTQINKNTSTNETYYYDDNQILVGALDLKTVENIDGKLVKPYYLFLEKPIEVIPKPTDTDGFYEAKNNILELQLILNENDINYLKQNEALGKKVQITGELFGPETAYHYSNVLMDVKKIEILNISNGNQETNIVIPQPNKINIFYGKLENGKEIKIFKEGDIYTYEYGSNGKVEISLSRKSGEGVFSDFGNFGGNAYVYNLRFINGEYSYIISKIITNKTDYELEVYKNNPNNLILEKAIKVVAGDIDEIHAEIEKDNESYLSW
ncbi:MAG: DUF4431 domain-containing protein [Fusobacterium gastrosuis]|uniref:DUF4431 domain-containing protein n=1 Tax=Fusobacterium gastrosuis TaxID=1755100 RepID=UPI002A92E3D2|nr:DUF4431 domain-containing protein [Fusobacterium gastrosuis]